MEILREVFAVQEEQVRADGELELAVREAKIGKLARDVALLRRAQVCLLRAHGTALSSVFSSSGAAPTAAIATICETRIPHTHNCTTSVSIRPGMSFSPAPRFAPSEPSRPVSSPLNRHTGLRFRARPEAPIGPALRETEDDSRGVTVSPAHVLLRALLRRVAARVRARRVPRAAEQVFGHRW